MGTRASTVVLMAGAVAVIMLLLFVIGTQAYEVVVNVQDQICINKWAQGPVKTAWTSGAPIPKRLYQIVLAPYTPSKFAGNMRTWTAANPDWRVEVVDDARAARFIAQHYPEWVKMYAALPKPVMKADVLRYMLVHTNGGMYTDLDTRCAKPIREWTRGDAGFTSKETQLVLAPEHDTICLCQSTFAAAPGHPMLRAVLDNALRRMRAFDFSRQLTNDDIYELSGPVLFTQAFEQVRPRVRLLPIRSMKGEFVVHEKYGENGEDGWKRTL